MSEPKVITPLVVMPPMEQPPDAVDIDSERFIEDTSVPTGLTFEEWLAARREPTTGAADEADIPEI